MSIGQLREAGILAFLLLAAACSDGDGKGGKTDGATGCVKDVECPVGYVCVAGSCVRKSDGGAYFGNFPHSIKFDIATDYPETAEPEDTFAENCVDVLISFEGVGESGRQVGVRSGSVSLILHGDGIEMRDITLRMQNVHISRQTVPPAGLWLGEIAVSGYGETGTYDLFSESRMVATVAAEVDVAMKFGTSEDPATWVELPEPFHVSGFKTLVELFADDEAWRLDMEATADATMQPVLLDNKIKIYFKGFRLSASKER